KMQPPAQQTPLKISCMLENGEENIDDIRNAILNAGVSAKIYFYSQKFIDVVPERAGVASAVKYLVDSLVLNSSQVFVGSGREQDAELFQFGFHGIVVNNASEKLKNSFGINAYFS
ncbi:MAG: HAD hydrolase family protein, partial [Aliifodinibius sp.]|nr:HAD hydrolase family protein [Fodinibius sp.]